MYKRFMRIDVSSKTPLGDAIMKEVHDDKLNVNVLVTGRPQMRKSSVGVALAWMLDRKFSFDDDFAIISTKDMMVALAGKAKRGTVKFLDEIGVGMDHHLWYSFFQRVMTHITQTFGFQGKIIISTVPYQDLVNKDMLKFFNIWIQIIGKNERDKFVVARVMSIEYDEQTQKVLYKYPRRRGGPKGPLKLCRISYKEVAENGMLDEYFRRSEDAKNRMQDELLLEADRVDLKSKSVLFSADRCADEVCAQPTMFSKVNQIGNLYISVDLVKNHFKIGGTRAKTVKVLAERKLGYDETGGDTRA